MGSGAGAGSAVAWFIVTGLARSEGWVEWALELKGLKLLRVRDLVVEEDLAEAGWQRWEERRRKRVLGQEVKKVL